jgi:Dockerin type I domain
LSATTSFIQFSSNFSSVRASSDSAEGTYNASVLNVNGGSSNLGPVIGRGHLLVSGASAHATASSLQQGFVTLASGGQLTVTGGGADNSVFSLTVSGGAVLNLTTTKLLINYPGVDPVSAIASYLLSGYNSGGWNGPGIDSSVAAVNHKYALGYADSADPGNPAGLLTEEIEIAYTLYGDTNLDGVVNSIDFGAMAANFGKSGKVWDQGDFDYNGTVNSIDFGLLAANFGKSASGADVEVSSSDWAALDAFAGENGLMSEVPEPAATGIVIVGSVASLSRRRRRRVEQN